jgi:hypothetical protein
MIKYELYCSVKAWLAMLIKNEHDDKYTSAETLENIINTCFVKITPECNF